MKKNALVWTLTLLMIGKGGEGGVRGGGYLSVCLYKQTNCTGWHRCILHMCISPLKLRHSYDFMMVQYNYIHVAEWLDTVS